MSNFMHSREDITQGYSLDMVTYIIGNPPLTKNLKAESPDVTHPWYADDVGALGMFQNVKLHFNFLRRFGPVCGY